MSHQLKLIPDPIRFACDGGELSGEVGAETLPRLADQLRTEGGSSMVRYRITGCLRDGKPFLIVHVSALLKLTCQRCLSVLACPVETEGRLLLVKVGNPLPDSDLEEDDFDPIHAERDFDVVDAVEEELLLALPLAPTHPDCSAPVAAEPGGKQSAFAALSNFRAQGRSDSQN